MARRPNIEDDWEEFCRACRDGAFGEAYDPEGPSATDEDTDALWEAYAESEAEAADPYGARGLRESDFY